ncbi:response regulator transcription factor [Nonomuraea sp. NPDC050790]|uniref:response regulator transcription factor n=1 Tax=Nonomuraea sp. NPDC050790 TaxID=3364371 RepID=UPI0037913F8B
MVHVHLIEDDASIRSALTRALSERGHAVSSSPTAMAGLNQVIESRPDVVVLDLGLPDLDGGEVLRMLRAVTSTPVVVASARDSEAEIVKALNAGADDYVIKPFGAEQLEARIKAVLRRAAHSEPGTAPAIEVGGLRVDPPGRAAWLDGTELELSPREFDLLHYLAARPGRVITKRELMVEVWHMPYGGADRTVDVHLSWLRRKLGETAENPRFLHTVRGVGVKLVIPDI